MRILLIVSLLIVSLKLSAKDSLFVFFNLNDCDACNAFVNNVVAIDTNNIEVTFVFMERYKNDKEDLSNMLGLKQVKLNYVFNDSLYNKYIINGSASSFVFNYNGRNYYKNYVKNGLQANIISNINKLYQANVEYDEKRIPLSNSINYLKQYGHEIYYIHPLRNTINVFSLIEETTGQSDEIIKFDKDLIAKAYRKIFSSSSFLIQNDYLSKNNLEMSVKLASIYKDSTGNLWVASSHHVLLYSDEFKDTVLINISGLYKFDINFKFLDYYPIHSIRDIDSLKFQFKANDYAPSIFDFYIEGNELVSNVSKLHSANALPNYYYGRFALDKTDNLVVVRTLLPDNYQTVGYNFHNIKISNDTRFYTLQLDDAIYYIEDKKAPIRLKIFKMPTQRMENRQFNNSISAPVYFDGKLYFNYKSEDDKRIAIFNLEDNKLEGNIDLVLYPEILNCKKWAFFDTSNPNYYLLINENGYLKRIIIE